MEQQNDKQVYVVPKLVEHGSVEELTQGTAKGFGADDGFTWLTDNGPPIGAVSCITSPI